MPTQFTMFSDDRVLIHLARPNPVWPHPEAASEVRLSIIGDYAYIPTNWRAKDDIPPEQGVPTSYYAAVQCVCAYTIVDDPQDKADLLAAQLADFQPEGRFADVSPDAPPYERMLPGIRGLRLDIIDAEAKLKFDDAKPVEFRQRVTANLDQRGAASTPRPRRSSNDDDDDLMRSESGRIRAHKSSSGSTRPLAQTAICRSFERRGLVET